MTLPVIKVELGFDSFTLGNWFTLDSATKGVLDSATYVLAGGTNFVDVTEYMMNIQVNRGKSRSLDRYNSGHVSVTFNNRNRFFDPTYAASPFYGQIVPRRDVKIWANGVMVFYGTTDDWNLDYSPSGDSTATLSAYDGFAFLAQQTLTSGSYSAEASGTRINNILTDPGTNWVYGTALDAGNETLQADTVTAADNVLQYLQVIETTEPGELFVSKSGALTFYERNHAFSSTTAPVLTDNGSGINYSQVRVVYGSELLYTQAEVSRKGSTTIIQANDLTAQSTYGVRTLSELDLLSQNDTSLANLATYLVGQYSAPEYRFDQVEIILSQISEANQNTMLGLDLGSSVKVIFTPNGIAPAIEKYAKIIAINHSVSLTEHRVTLGLGTLNTNTFILDDPAFGILDTSILAY